MEIVTFRMIFWVFYMFALSQHNLLSKENVVNCEINEAVIQLLNQKAAELIHAHPDEALDLSNVTLSLIRKHKCWSGFPRAYNIRGLASQNLGNYSYAKMNYDSSLYYGYNLNDTLNIYKCNGNILMLYFVGYLSDYSGVKQLLKKLIFYAMEHNRREDLHNYILAYSFYVHYFDQADVDTLYECFNLTGGGGTSGRYQELWDMGKAYYCTQKKDYMRAINYYNKAMGEFDVKANINLHSLIVESVASLYLKMKRFNDAIIFYKEALKLSLKAGDSSKVMMHYESLGSCYFSKKEYISAYNYFLKVEKNWDTFSFFDKYGAINNHGLCYLELDSLVLAAKCFNELKAEIHTLPTEYQRAFLHSLALYYDRVNAEVLLSEVVHGMVAVNADIYNDYIQSDSYHFLSDYFERKGELSKSIEYLKKAILIDKSISAVESKNVLTEFLIKYESEKQLLMISNQQDVIQFQETKIILFGVLSGLMTIAGGVIIWFYRKKINAYKLLSKTIVTNVSVNAENIQKFESAIFNAKACLVDDAVEEKDSVLSIDLYNRISQKLDELIRQEEVFTFAGVTINDLAEKCETNRTYLSRIINEKYNLGFNNLMNKLRIEKAIYLMNKDDFDTPLKVLYAEIGFASKSTFYEAFKRYTGIPPLFYLNQIKRRN